MVFVAEILVLIDKRLPHARGVFFIHTKHDGLLETVAALLEELGNLLRDQLGAVIDDEGAVEVLGVVDPILDLVAVAVRARPSPGDSLRHPRQCEP